MDYKIAFTPGAEKDYKNLKKNKSVLNKIERAFTILRKNPYAGKFLVGDLKGYHSYRTGNYRIIYEIIHSKILILILKIDKRGSLYN